jgi:Multidrug resistance efflux pump
MLLAAGCLALAVALAVWIYVRQRHITENDAKVMADMITISSRVDGWVAKRPVTDGDLVAQGAELAVIDQREAAMQVDELTAKDEALRLESERVQTQLGVSQGSTRSAVEAAQARSANAEANLRSTAAELERVRLDYVRYQKLVAVNAVSRQVWDQSRTAYQQADERNRQAKAQLSEAKANLSDSLAHRGDPEVLKMQLAELEQQRAEVQAQIKQKQVALADRVVRSPINGVVDQKFVEPGEYVIPGQRLVLLHDPKAVWVEVNLKETKLAGLKPGQPVSVSVDAYPDRAFTGHIERIGTAATNQFALMPSPNPSGNFTKISQRVPVRIKVDQPSDNPLRPGMMVEVDIDRSHD